MAKNNDYKHLTPDQRITILEEIKKNTLVKDIAIKVKKDPTTVSKEVKHHRYLKETNQKHLVNPGYFCKYFESCQIKGLCHYNCRTFLCKRCKNIDCTKKCEKFELYVCKRLKRFPYVCNGCDKIMGCKRNHYYYDPKYADRDYRKLLIESRTGIDVEEDSFKLLDQIISKGVLDGKSLYAILHEHPEINKSERTIYRYIHNRYLGVKDHDLRNKCKMKPRTKYKYEKESKTIKVIRENRTYDDYIKFMCEHPSTMVAQLDLVEGLKTDHQYILTILFPIANFMLGFLIPNKESQSVVNIFNNLNDILGNALFKKLFPCILTDRGREFTDVIGIEFNPFTGEKRTSIFFCNAYSSCQKAQLERNHQFIRFFFPKGSSIDNLNQNELNLILSHINSYPRESKNDNSPYRIASLLFGDEILLKLGISFIPFDQIKLNKSLIRKLK